MIYRALEWNPPNFMHLPMLLDESGAKLSKRIGSLAISQLKVCRPL